MDALYQKIDQPFHNKNIGDFILALGTLFNLLSWQNYKVRKRIMTAIMMIIPSLMSTKRQ